MKILVVLFIILFSSCSSVEKGGEDVNVNKEKHIIVEEQAAPISEEDIGYAFTTIYDKGENRVENIKLACNFASGKILMPGEEFSFNNAVGKRSIEKGFKEAPVLVSGESETDIGGGVCQVSSTIYMAVINAGLEVIERHPHSKSVVYAPHGLDAAVVYGEKDFKFINNTNEPIYIYVWTDNEKIHSKILKKY